MSDDHAADVQRYIDGVRDGSIVTGRLQRLAVHRHCDDLKLAGERGFYFDERLAWNAIEFSLCCRHFKGEWAGLPLSLRPEQKFIAWCLFGWRKKSNGYRRFRHAQMELARKAGKSTLIAYIVCLLMYADCPFEPAAEGVCVATQKEQARTVWDMVSEMVKQSPDLNEMSRILHGCHEIRIPDSKSWFKPLAIDENSGDSFSLHILVKDEEHAYRHQHRKMMRALGSGFGARRQPLSLTITTYGDDKSDIWKENHDYAVKIVESVISGQIIDDSWFVFIAALDYPTEYPCFRCRGDNCPWCEGDGTIKADDPFNEKAWFKANPGLPLTPKIDVMRADANEARHKPDKKAEFLQKNLNVIVSSRTRVILPEVWLKSRRTETEASLIPPVVSCGAFDLGRSNDFASVADIDVFAEVDDDGDPFKRYEIRSKSWTVEDRPKELQIPMIGDWIANGHIEQSSGDSVDFMDVQSLILSWHAEHNVRTWAYDKTFAQQMAQMLVAEGVEVFPFTQGARYYTEPITEFLKLIGKTRVVNGIEIPLIMHDGCPCLAWQAGNLVTIKNARGEVMPDKSSSMNKIDAMVAILMAFSECLYHQKDSTQGYYLTNSLAIGGSFDSDHLEESTA